MITPAPHHTADASGRLVIEIWADIICSWCHLAESRLERALAQFPHKDEISLVVRTFQLHPDAPRSQVSTVEYMAAKQHVSVEQMRSGEQEMATFMASEELIYEAERPFQNTLDSLRLIHLGSEYGVGYEYLRAMQGEVFAGHSDAFELSTLIRLGQTLGVPGDKLHDVLTSNQYVDAVQADHREAVGLGATGVPFTVFGRRYGLAGAVSVDQYTEALNQAWKDETPRH